MNYYPFHIGDYKSHTEHYDLLEDLAFRRMLDWCYLHEKPLPSDIEDIARLIRMRTHNECIAYVLREQFIETDDGYINKRVSKEVGKYQEKSEKAKKSAEARWKKKPADNNDLADANAMPTQCESNANQEPRTKNQKPITNSKDSASPLAQEIFAYWVKIMAKTGNVTFTKKRMSLVKDRLKDGYSVEDIKKAIDNCSVTPWNTGSNPQNKRFDDLELICRTGEKLEQFRDSDPLENKKVDAHSGFDKRDYSVGATDESITDRW